MSPPTDPAVRDARLYVLRDGVPVPAAEPMTPGELPL